MKNKCLNNPVYLSVFIAGMLLLTACVGPTTPFGAIDTWTVPKKEVLVASSSKQAVLRGPANVQKDDGFYAPTPVIPSIRFNPDRQVIHSPSLLKVAVKDPSGIPEKPAFRVLYNGYDMSKKFVRRARVVMDEDEKQLLFEYPRLKLRADQKNRIQFSYKRDLHSDPLTRTYKPPVCHMFDDKSIETTGTFEPEDRLLAALHVWSRAHNINPTLMAGLIAQESSFDPLAVSWAKAIGLTQVTPLADKEVAKVHHEWPRSKDIERLPAAVVKTMIRSGKISESEDWRLNPELSVRGGLTYLNYLHRYWSISENYKFVEDTFAEPDSAFTPIILASYNSGAARVKYAIKRFGPNYLDADELTEAKKYVARVTSYCYHFSSTGEAL